MLCAFFPFLFLLWLLLLVVWISPSFFFFFKHPIFAQPRRVFFSKVGDWARRRSQAWRKTFVFLWCSQIEFIIQHFKTDQVGQHLFHSGTKINIFQDLYITYKPIWNSAFAKITQPTSDFLVLVGVIAWWL